VFGQLGAVLGVPAGIGLSWWVSRLESPSQAREREEISRDLPLAADLLSACVLVGRPVDEALLLVSRALGGALGVRLDRLTARLALGSDPLTEWRRATVDPQLAPLARAMVRTLESGAPIGDALSRLAEDRRRERRTQTQLRARNVGVKAAGPLAACFLPAFMLIGIVPTIAGAFSNLVL
jgi:pilus assembly protein TadC